MTRRGALRLLAGATGVAAVAPLTGAAAAPGTARGAGSTPVREFGGHVASQWFDLARQLVQGTPGYSPPVASRAFAYFGVALYEALLPGMPGHRSLAGLVGALPSIPATGHNAAYHWPSVANRVLAEMSRRLFPTAPRPLGEAIESLEGRLAATFRASAPQGVFNRSVDRGTVVAAAAFDWSHGDGGHEAYLRNFSPDYTPPVGAGLWVPTPPGLLPALQPRWGANRCFVLTHSDDCAPPPPASFSTDPTSTFLAEAVEVYQIVDRLTAEQRTIARFWSDDPGTTSTPPGHSVSILSQVLRDRDASLELAAEAYARVGLAVADAFIACWRTKYRHNLLRPITCVRGTLDPGWGDPDGRHPLPLVTPPFPEYTSGHSVQSAATAVVLASLFGALAFTDHTHDERGFDPRSFPSFDAAADEAAISRLYGGIHFRSAVERGLEQGRCIGERVAALRMRR